MSNTIPLLDENNPWTLYELVTNTKTKDISLKSLTQPITSLGTGFKGELLFKDSNLILGRKNIFTEKWEYNSIPKIKIPNKKEYFYFKNKEYKDGDIIHFPYNSSVVLTPSRHLFYNIIKEDYRSDIIPSEFFLLPWGIMSRTSIGISLRGFKIYKGILYPDDITLRYY